MFDRIDKGLWWDRAWTLTRGCTPVSTGCLNCWSAADSHRKGKNQLVASQYGMTDDYGHWTGKVETLPQNLHKPLHVKKPQVWAIWNDLFHEKVERNFQYKVFEMILNTPHHIYVILTKRPEIIIKSVVNIYLHLNRNYLDAILPLPNVWLGVTIESPDYLWRVKELLRIPASKHFVSVEPMLSSVTLQNLHGAEPRYLGRFICTNCGDEPPGFECNCCIMNTEVLNFVNGKETSRIDWVICGCESGTNRRAFNEDWARDLRDQCVASKTPFFLKQSIQNGKLVKMPDLDGKVWKEKP